ncbi:UNVERIFIED_CONTAM: hypothetical protein RMT77_012237 [Armadillidium vulgare]
MILGDFEKKCFTIFSIQTFVIGFGVIILRAKVSEHIDHVENFTQGKVVFPYYTLIPGGIITFNALFFMWGILRHNKISLSSYVLESIILLTIEFFGGTNTLTMADQAVTLVKVDLKKKFEEYGKNVFEAFASNGSSKTGIAIQREEDLIKIDLNFDVTQSKHTVDLLQKKVKCCGVESYKDWTEKLNASLPPQSCCKDGVPCDTNSPDFIYKDGCYQKTLDLIGEINEFGYTAIMFALLQLIPVCFAMTLIKNEIN